MPKLSCWRRVLFWAARFILAWTIIAVVALAIRLGGERAERALHKYIEPIGWAVVVLVLALLGWLLLRGHAA